MADFSPARNFAAVTPSNSTNLPGGVCAGIYVGGVGDVAVVPDNGTPAGGAAVVFTALAAGIVHPIKAFRINSTSTTATGIVAVYN